MYGVNVLIYKASVYTDVTFWYENSLQFMKRVVYKTFLAKKSVLRAAMQSDSSAKCDLPFESKKRL